MTGYRLVSLSLCCVFISFLLLSCTFRGHVVFGFDEDEDEDHCRAAVARGSATSVLTARRSE